MNEHQKNCTDLSCPCIFGLTPKEIIHQDEVGQPKPKCPVFGCTIPRGIPHEHPAGVSAVMRDPAEPLNADERAELEAFRHQKFKDLVQSGELAPCRGALDSFVTRGHLPAMDPSRKLRDALLLAGHKPGDTLTLEEVKPAPRRTLAQSVGKIAAWLFSIPALVLAAFAIGTYFGWWI